MSHPPTSTQGSNGHTTLEGLASVVTVDRADDIAAVCGRLDTAPTYAVVIHAPGGNRSLATELGMRRLQRHAEESGKIVAIATRSLALGNRARQVGIPVARKPEQVRWDAAGHRVVRVGRWSMVTPRVGGYAQVAVILVVLAVFAALALTMAPSADVIIVPPADTISEVVTVTASPKLDAIDFGAMKVPARRLSSTQRVTLALKPSGKVQVPTQPAKVVVAITNGSSADVTLPAGTVFLAAPDQQPFLLALDTRVPAGQTVTQGVTASRLGSVGNVPPGAISSFEDPRYKQFRVTNAEAGVGGASEERIGVDQKDVLALRNLAQDLQKSDTVRRTILVARPHDAVFLHTAEVTVEVGDPRPALGTPADLVLLDADVTVTVLAIPAGTLEELALHVLGSKQGKGEFIPGSVTAVETGATQADAEDGSVTTEVRLSGLFARNVTRSDIEEAVKGKSPGEARSILKERYGIEDPDVSVSPGWAPWLPRFDFRIDVELKGPTPEIVDATGVSASNRAPSPATATPSPTPRP